MTIKGNGKATIASSGVPVQLGSAGVVAVFALLTAGSGNAGTVYFGTSTVNASTGSGTPLAAGDSATILVDALGDCYLDSTESGDTVSYTYFS